MFKKAMIKEFGSQITEDYDSLYNKIALIVSVHLYKEMNPAFKELDEKIRIVMVKK